jgi:hypothetical protein
MENDPFLKADGVKTEGDAVTMSFKGALQRNRTYREGVREGRRKEFRTEWAKLIREESNRYVQPAQPISDIQHCEAIRRIAESLSHRFEEILEDGRLRYGTSQKAFNLYLKYLWRLGKAATPPHCPLDSIVLAKGKVSGAWTKCDSQKQYMGWITALRTISASPCLAEWEYQVWLQGALNKRSQATQSDVEAGCRALRS